VEAPIAATRGLIKLSDAAHGLGYHVETLRLRVRRGELEASRGAHGAYYLTQAALASIGPPARSASRQLALDSFAWSWVTLEQDLEDQGASRDELRLLEEVRRDPTLDRILYRLMAVKRLRLAGLRSMEIGALIGISARQVRRLTRRDLRRTLAELGKDPWSEEDYEGGDDGPVAYDDDGGGVALDRIEIRHRRRKWRAAYSVVAQVQSRLAAEGFQRHRRAQRPDDNFIVPGRGAAAFKVKSLPPEVVRHLLDAGLTSEQIAAIKAAGIGQDELNELILKGLRPPTAGAGL
jgi:hypothetical protein